MTLTTISRSQVLNDPGYSILVADIDIMQIEGLEYIELVGQQRLLNPFQVKVWVDYGQKVGLFTLNQTIRDGSRGRNLNGTAVNMSFQSMIDALNFFNQSGWEYVNQYAITVKDENVYHILLRKRK